MRSVERAFKARAVLHPTDEDDDGHLTEVPKKKLMFSPEAAAIKTPPISIGSLGAGSTYRAAAPPYKWRVYCYQLTTVLPHKATGAPT